MAISAATCPPRRSSCCAPSRAGCTLAAGHLLGTTLGEPIVYRIDVSWLLGVGLVLALLAAALPVQDESDALLGRRTKAGVVGIILCVVAASLVVGAELDAHQLPNAFGMQGRYLLPDAAAGAAAGKRQKPQRLCAARYFPRGGAGRHRLYTVDPAARLWPVRQLAAGIINCNTIIKENTLMTITKNTIIAEILNNDPTQGCVPIFLSTGMHCLGCMASHGETVEEACAVHGVDPTLVAELNDYFAHL